MEIVISIFIQSWRWLLKQLMTTQTDGYVHLQETITYYSIIYSPFQWHLFFNCSRFIRVSWTYSKVKKDTSWNTSILHLFQMKCNAFFKFFQWQYHQQFDWKMWFLENVHEVKDILYFYPFLFHLSSFCFNDSMQPSSNGLQNLLTMLSQQDLTVFHKAPCGVTQWLAFSVFK